MEKRVINVNCVELKQTLSLYLLKIKCLLNINYTHVVRNHHPDPCALKRPPLRSRASCRRPRFPLFTLKGIEAIRHHHLEKVYQRVQEVQAQKREKPTRER